MSFKSLRSPTGVVVSLFVLSAALLLIGWVFSESTLPPVRVAGVVLMQLSGALLAAVIATIYFSLEDVKKHIATTAATLVTSGELISSLVDSSRNTLDRQLTLATLKGNADSVEPGLLAVLNRIKSDNLSLPHLHNFYQEIRYEAHPRDARLCVRAIARRFRVKSYHLTTPRKSFPLNHNLEVGIPHEITLSDLDILLDFDVQIGELHLNRDDVKIARVNSGTMPSVRISFAVEAPMVDEFDVRVRVRSIASADDRTDILIARYPTFGFSASVRCPDDVYFDCAWFKNWAGGTSFEAGQKNLEKLADGIEAYSHDWVLPGEGVAISWYPKPQGHTRDPEPAAEGLGGQAVPGEAGEESDRHAQAGEAQR
jgi:hypothetical protein